MKHGEVWRNVAKLSFTELQQVAGFPRSTPVHTTQVILGGGPTAAVTFLQIKFQDRVLWPKCAYVYM